MFITGYDQVRRCSSWSVSENSTILNKSFVCERPVGNGDIWAKSYVNGDDGSVLGMEFAKGEFQFQEGFAEP